MKHEEKIWDIVVIGGGPAGMMAAGRAAEVARIAGKKISILLIEKNDSLGKKLLITGGGRCNVTNAEFDNRILLEKFKDDSKYLFSAFAQYSVKDALEFFNTRGMETKIEANTRVFPVSNRAQSVWDVLVNYIHNNATVLSNSPVKDIMLDAGTTDDSSVDSTTNAARVNISEIILKNGKRIRSKQFIIATGGKSHPETGSTGDAFSWLTKAGHTVTEPSVSLVPIRIKDSWVTKLAGVTLQDVKISVFQNNTKQTVGDITAIRSKVLFTHFGISGPTVLNMSRDIGELLQYGEVEVSLDLLPSHDYATLNTALQDLFKLHHTKKIKNALTDLIPSALVPVALSAVNIDQDTACNSITRDERNALVKSLKDIRMQVEGLLDSSKAIITSGGVALDEIDWKTMCSRKVNNLFIIGDMLNIDRPSGGYSLQLCWTTGYIAGTTAAESHEQ